LGSQAGSAARSWPALTPDVASIALPQTDLANIHDLAFSPAADVLALAGGSPGDEGHVELFTWPAAKLIRRLATHADVVSAVAWRPDGRVLATAGADRAVKLTDMTNLARTGEECQVATLAGHSRGVLAAAWLADGHTLVTTGADQSLRVWGVSESDDARGTNSSPLVARRTFDNHTGTVHALAARPVAKGDSPPMLASISADRTLRLWQPTIGRMMRFARLESEPLSLAWTRDGRRVATGCVDGRVRVIDPDTAEVVADLPGIDGWAYVLVAAPDDDAMLVAGADGQVAVARIEPD
jgi:WD40 repeat protein